MSTWLDAAARFAQERGLSPEHVGVLRCFAGPEPRGGPPPPPEEPWDGDFAGLERARLSESLAGIAGRLVPEVDRHQAELFGRRLQAVDTALAGLGDDVGRLLRVGLRQRAQGIASAPSARATRIRALADFYFSYAGLHLHRSSGPLGASIETLAAEVAWQAVVRGVEHAKLTGLSDLGPLHVNLLRIDPAQVRLRTEDCRAVVDRGESFESHVRARGAVAGISGGFFLYSEPDIEAPSRRFDPVGLLVEDGRVLSPPAFARGSLLVDDRGAVSIARVGPGDCELQLPSGRRLRPAAAINRAHGRQGPRARSIAVVGDAIVAVGESLPVPLNGLVVPLPDDEPSPSVGERVRYPAVHGPTGPVHMGIAGGPLLVSEGRPTLDMRREDFWGTAPPVTFSQDETGDRNLLPRLAAGLTGEGMLVLAAIDGRNFERALGMTLHDVGRLLVALGCHTATNLDGGSSKRMVVGGRAQDLTSTEIVSEGVATVSIRPVHTGVLVFEG
ncbi:phosphodiester glycosidase family protein [Paraliomyxa miuraensis]|uniref:phosphodiester glycosidase family protein n=1 Tax=Paraliomyxa miuraensis TaxID=376150 RepID=UPI00224DBF36|nr:phosphodiester glycosidase family protein [Paraliomyxa miuraensis]MCX4241928.1 phosphodiester glycosidase family protein [Paraliomyxa miuraensis]